MENQEDLKLKFYADTPAGQVNKLFVFKVKGYDHAIDLAAKFVQEYQFKIRAAFFQNLSGLSMRFDKLIDLNEHQCSLIEKNDREKLLSIVEQDLKTMSNTYDSSMN